MEIFNKIVIPLEHEFEEELNKNDYETEGRRDI